MGTADGLSHIGVPLPVLPLHGTARSGRAIRILVDV